MTTDVMPSAPLVTILDRVVASGDGQRPAVHTEHGSVSYTALLELVTRAAWRMQRIGLRVEDRVLIELDDSVEMIAAFLGAVRIGAVPVLINPWAGLRPYALEHSRARCLIVDTDEGADHQGCDVITGSELISPIPDDPGTVVHLAHVNGEDAAFWLFSSGSTGRPKAVVHLHRDVAGSCERYAGDVLQLRRNDVCFSTAKMFHAYGLGGGLLFPFWHGASVAYLRGKPGPVGVSRTVAQSGATVLFSVPGLYNAVLRYGVVAEDFSSLRCCVSAAEPLAPAVAERWHAELGVEILDGVGSTEMLHIYCSNRPGDAVAGSAGYPVPGYELQLRPYTDEPGAPDEMWVRGPSAFDRYWRNQEATRAAFHGAWFRTGDCFEVSEGRYWYLGRVDDMMKIGGLWISANVIECELTAHPLVAENAVVRVSVGDVNRIKAYVVTTALQAGQRRTLLHDLRRWCHARLPSDHVPHYIECVESLPKTASGKVQRFALSALTPAK